MRFPQQFPITSDLPGNLDAAERSAYQVGDLGTAHILGALLDAEKAREEAEVQLDDSPDPDEVKRLQEENDDLRELLRAANEAVDRLYGQIEDSKRLNKKAILAALASVELVAP